MRHILFPRVASLAALWMLVMTSVGFASQIIYVDARATGPNDGSSWQSAHTCLQDALTHAGGTAKPVDVHVAQGVYQPDRGAGVTRGNKEATFQLINGVALRGGYAGLEGPDPNVRDVRLYESILSGDLTGDDPDVNDPRELLHPTGWNSKTVVTGSGTDANAVLDGFVVAGGHHSVPIPQIDPKDPPPPTGWGGGMNNVAGSPTVIKCTFTGNMTSGAGAGMCNVGGSHPTVVDCVFTRNYAHGPGGGLLNIEGSDATLLRCTFVENVAVNEGGAVQNHRSNPVFENCMFFRNSVSYAYAGGGAMCNQESICKLSDCKFEENSSPFRGGQCTSGTVAAWFSTTAPLLAIDHMEQVVPCTQRVATVDYRCPTASSGTTGRAAIAAGDCI